MNRLSDDIGRFANSPFTMLPLGSIGWSFERDPNLKSSQPAYDLYTLTDDDGSTTHHLEIDVASYHESSVDVFTEGKTLRITADPRCRILEATYIANGLTRSQRQLDVAFDLDSDIEVSEARTSNGILSIVMVRNIPEGQKRRQIKVKKTTS